MKKQNINRNKQLGRIVDVGNGFTQITINDLRFYKRADTYYPSVSYILQSFPKGKNFENWMKTNGVNSNNIAQEAMDKGSLIHNSIEDMLLYNKELEWIDEDGCINYSTEEWLMLMRFVEFWTIYKPKLIASEVHVHSDKHKYAGTIDLIIELNGELWLLDIKTSNNLHTTYDLQLSSYIEAWNEQNIEQQVKKSGILWLNANTRKSSSDINKIQGRNWQLVLSERTQDENFQIFLSVKSIFHLENPNPKPSIDQYPNSLKINII